MSSNFRKKTLAAALSAVVLAAGSLCAGGAAASPERAGSVFGATAPYGAGSTFGAAAPNGAGSTFGAAAPYASEGQAVQRQSDGTYHIVAVGDSVTVGYKFGITDQAAIYGYVDRVYEQALYRGRAESRNFGVLGLKTEGLRRWLEAARDGSSITGEEAQPGITKYPLAAETIGKSADLRSAIEQADLVVMTIGGNDFLPLFDDMQQRQVPPDELETRIAEILDTYKTSLTASLKAITDMNPKAEIVFADQYLPVPDPKTNKLIKFITADQYAVLLEGTKKLRELVESLGGELRTEGFDAKTVDLSEPFLGHELIYTSIVKGKGDSHPTDDGYEQIGEAFAETIWGEYRKPEALAGGSPLRIVVNGTNVDGPNKPALINGTTFLPMRDVAKALGASLAWDGKTRTATLRTGDKTVAFTIGARTMKINGSVAALETPAYLDKKSAATYLPLAALSKGLGYQVVYRKPILTVFINS